MMLTEKQIDFLKSLGLDYDYTKIDNFSDEWAEIEERVGDELEYRGLDDDFVCEEVKHDGIQR